MYNNIFKESDSSIERNVMYVIEKLGWQGAIQCIFALTENIGIGM
jgi:hypothetical protein